VSGAPHRATGRGAVFGLLLALVSCPSAATASPLDAFGLGARATALGGAVTATTSGIASNYYNPAALAAERFQHLEIGYTFVQPRLRLNGGDLGVDPHRGAHGGFSVVGDLFGRRLGFSLGLYMPDRMLTRTRSLRQSQPRFVTYDNRPQRFVMGGSLAYEIVRDQLFAGVGLTFMSHTEGTLDVRGEVDMRDAELSKLFTSIEEDLSSVRYPTFGLLWRPSSEWWVGLTWREEFVLHISLDVIISGDVQSRGITLVEDGSFSMTSDNRNHFSPRQIALGVGHAFGRWLVEVDLTWLQWSRFPAPTSEVTLSLELGALPAEMPPIDTPLEPHFSDILVPRAGVEWHALEDGGFDLLVRGGYFYEPSPAPEQTGTTNFIDADKHGLSAGVGLRLPFLPGVLHRPLELDLAAQLIVLAERAHLKEDPADPIGDMVADGLLVGGTATLGFAF